MRADLAVARPILSARHASVLLAAHSLEDDVGAVALVAGTAIGGGFLALPATTAPAGCVPSALLLLGASGALLAEAYIVADLVIEVSRQEGRPVSLSTCARRTLGGTAGAAVEALFILLMCSTLVSQFAKGGSLLSSWLGLPYQAGCALVVASLSLFSLGAPRHLISQVNGRLAAGFAISLAALFACGAPLADWTALYRADWPAAYASAPTILQLLVYNEIVPTTLFTDLADRTGKSTGDAAPPPADQRTTVSGTYGSGGWWRFGALPLSLLASLICASLSPDAFFGAIDFAGAYPVALLWGVAPPVMALAAARREGSRLRPRTVVGLVGLALAAMLFVASNAATDIGEFVMRGAGGAARWRR